MSNNLIHQSGGGASPQQGGGISRFSKPEQRAMTRAQNAEIARGMVTATRIQAAGHVTATAMHMTSMLSREAAFLADGDPQTAARLNFIVDSFADNAAWEVRQFRG